MFTFQYLDNLDQEEINKFQQAYSIAKYNPNYDFQYVETGLTHFMGIQIAKCVLITLQPNGHLPLHVDQRNGLALNIPLLNCEQTVTELWECDRPYSVGFTKNGIPYHYYPKDTVKEKLGEFILTKPVLFDVQVPHSSTNYSNSMRLAISLRFMQEPWHLVSMS
jgi:hypothetical protein